VIIVRLAAALVLVALALVLVFLWKRDRRYLKWAWRLFLAALFCMLGVLTVYFVERMFI
jgi:intracellular septation protein A